MSIDTCNPFSLLGAPYQKAVCNSETSLGWQLFTDNACTQMVEEYTYNETSALGDGAFLDFDCTLNRADRYAAVEFSLGACVTNTKVTMNAAVGVCAQNTDIGNGELTPDEWRSIEVYCDDTIAALLYFDNPGVFTGDCSEAKYYQERNATTTCGYMLTSGDNDIYGTLISCTEGGDADSASSVSMVFALLVGSILAALY